LNIVTYLDNVLFDEPIKKIKKTTFKIINNLDSILLELSSKYKDKLNIAVYKYQNGDKYQYEYIYSIYEKKLSNGQYKFNDTELAAELLDVALLQAVNSWNINGNTKFNTYFWRCAKNYMCVYNKHNNAKKRLSNKNTYSLDKDYKDDTNSNCSLESIIEDKQQVDIIKNINLINTIKSMTHLLTNREIFVLMGLINKFTLEEIGSKLNVTSAAVCIMIKKIRENEYVSNKLYNVLTC